MTKSKRHHKVSGAVLVMVLIVMVVLIMMLMATLTVVTTASKRIYTKYEENQAYYTARSALDVFWQNIVGDSYYYAYDASGHIREYEYTDPDTGSVVSKPMKQGLALEAELYKITSQAKSTKEVAKRLYPSMSDEEAAEALDFLENPEVLDEVFDASSPENEFYSIQRNSGGASSDNLEYITYKIKLPDLSENAAAYGSLVDTDKTTGEQVATLKVEVIDRMFNLAGNYGDNDTEIRESIINIFQMSPGTERTNKINQLKQDIRNGDRTKDVLIIKVTATTEVKGTQGEASLVINVHKKPEVNAEKSITTVSDISEGSGIFPVGGASSLGTGTYAISEGAVTVGDMFLKGDLSTDGGSETYMFKETTHFVEGNVNFQDSYFDWIQEGSVLYSMGTVNLDLASNFGGSSAWTNVVANEVRFSGNAVLGSNFFGNVYADRLYIGYGNGTQIPNITGGIYTNYIDLTEHMNTLEPTVNSVTFKSGTFDANISTLAPYISVAKGFYINVNIGGVALPEKFTWDGVSTLTRESTGDVYTIDTSSEIVPLFNYQPLNELKINYFDPTHYAYDNYMKTFTLPAPLAGRGDIKLEVPTTRYLYSSIFKEAAFVDDPVDSGRNGELDGFSMPTFDATGLVITDPNTGLDVPQDIITGISDGTINDANYWEYGYTWQQWNDTSWDAARPLGLKSTVIQMLELAKQGDAVYQQALADYYAMFISGAERAGEEGCDDLLKYRSDSGPVPVKSINDGTVTAPEDFAIGGKYEELSGATQIIDQSGFLQSNRQYGNSYSPVIIDARTNSITLQLGAENGMGTYQERGSNLTFLGNFVVVGDKTVKIYLPDGRDYSLGTTATGTGAFTIQTYHFYTDNDVSIGPSGDTEAPNVYMYAGNEVENIYVNAPGAERFLTAYIYVPFANFDMSAASSSGRQFDSAEYVSQYGIGVPIEGESDFGYTVAGSLIANNYQSNNKTGVLFVSPESGGAEPGEPQLDWEPEIYTRN